jgi:hypothetical protein
MGDGKMVLAPWCEKIESEEWVKETTKVCRGGTNSCGCKWRSLARCLCVCACACACGRGVLVVGR